MSKTSEDPRGRIPAQHSMQGWLEGGLASLNQKLEVVELNHALASWLGIESSQAAGSPFASLVEQVLPQCPNLLASALDDGEGFCREYSISSERLLPPQWFRLEILRHPGGCFLRLNSILPPAEHLAEGSWNEHLVSEEAQREMFVRLLRAETQLDSLVHRWPGVIFSQRADFSLSFVSANITELTGVSPAEWRRQPHRFWEVVHEADIEELRQQIRTCVSNSKGITSTYRIRNLRTGKVAYILEHRQAVMTRGGMLLGYEGIWLDVTRQTIAEKRLSSAAWKETLAHLTMGLAHDFSNVMAGIHSLSESFLAQIAPDHPFFEGLELIKQNSLQASQLVHRIINLHHGKTGERDYHNLNDIVADILDLVRKILPRRVEVAFEPAPEPLPLYVDAVEFRQVIINLILNAADAMPNGGRLTFRTSRHEEVPEPTHLQGTVPRLPVACLAVQDTGCGIRPAHLPLIFDPFFTTKSVNKGSGLGLYNARLFVEKHHGAVSVDSVEDKGTTFRIWLPQSDFTEAEQATSFFESVRRSLVLLGTQGAALDHMAEFLRSHGYHVVATSSPEHAVACLEAREYPFLGAIGILQENESGIDGLFEAAKKPQPPLRTVLQLVGRNQDEVSNRLSELADLIVAPDLPQPVLLDRLEALFEESAATL